MIASDFVLPLAKGELEGVWRFAPAPNPTFCVNLAISTQQNLVVSIRRRID